jgi:hypothetical protein
MPRIGRVCRIQILPWPTVIEATCARVCNRAHQANRRRFEAQAPNPEPREWATGRFPRAQPAKTVALSAAFGRAAPRGCRATMDIPVSGQPGAAEAPCVAVGAAATVVGEAATVAAGITRCERES